MPSPDGPRGSVIVIAVDQGPQLGWSFARHDDSRRHRGADVPERGARTGWNEEQGDPLADGKLTAPTSPPDRPGHRTAPRQDDVPFGLPRTGPGKPAAGRGETTRPAGCTWVTGQAPPLVATHLDDAGPPATLISAVTGQRQH